MLKECWVDLCFFEKPASSSKTQKCSDIRGQSGSFEGQRHDTSNIELAASCSWMEERRMSPARLAEAWFSKM